MTDAVTEATSDADFEEFGALILEYENWLRERYTDVPGLIDGVRAHQDLDAELATLPAKYGPPAGRTLLARREGHVTGGIAYRDLGDGTCEMKRLFVPDRYQGHGTGRVLCEALISSAAADGYRVMRLDTGVLNSEAIAMYTVLGFRECPPYGEYPDDLRVHLRFMELVLTDQDGQ
jgi:GNAT superfamily N-acetyltransferase